MSWLSCDSSGISAITAALEAMGVECARVEIDGAPVLIHGPQDHPRPVHSIRKSVMSLLLDEVITTGRLRLSTTLHELGIDDPGLRWPASTITVEHLVSSSSGNFDPVAPEDRDQLVQAGIGELADRRPERPGRRWRYNNWDFNALGAVYATASGRSVFDGVDRLAELVGLRDWNRTRDATWRHARDALGANERFPNYTMRLSARDLARLGASCLSSLDGFGPFSTAWLRTSTRDVLRETDLPEPRARYGYLWWAPSPDAPHMPAGSFWAWGSGGQYLLVIPDRRLVAVLLRPIPQAGGWEPPVGSLQYFIRVLAAGSLPQVHGTEQRGGLIRRPW